MVNPTFDAGTFLILLVLGVISLFASIKLGAIFKLLGAIIFFTLGTILLAGYDVESMKMTTDGTTVINETNFLIGNTNADPNHTASWLGYIFLIIGILASILFFIEIIPKSGGT